ncbi:TPA: hypothetical protein ACUB6G_005440 [Klebsiella pneumoniae]
MSFRSTEHQPPIPEVNNYDNKRELTESPATEIFRTIERIRDQQSKIDYEQQSIRERLDDVGNKINITDGGIGSIGRRFGFFGDYFDRFSIFIEEKLRTVVEFITEAERKKKEKRQQKQEVKPKKAEVTGRPRFGKKY